MNDAPQLFPDGQFYERFMGRWSQRVAVPFLDWLALSKGLRWLDVGCGNGAFTEMLLARAAPAEVVGIDPSEQQLAYARTRAGAQTAEFRVASAQALPFADRRFDAAIMPLVITFVPDPPKAVQEMARVVQPGGCVAAYMWDVPGGGLPMHPIYTAMRALGIEYREMPGADASRRDRLQALWQQAGLQSIETHEIRIKIDYSGFDDFWESHSGPVGPIGQRLAKLAPEAIERLKAELRRQLPKAVDGSIAYEAYANAVKGRVPA